MFSLLHALFFSYKLFAFYIRIEVQIKEFQIAIPIKVAVVLWVWFSAAGRQS